MAFFSRLKPGNLAVVLSTDFGNLEKRISINQINAGMTRYDPKVCEQRNEQSTYLKPWEQGNKETGKRRKL